MADDLKNSSPLLIKYLRAFEANRSSRVFAPLAETYRKIGMLDEALKVLREGIKRHPTYTLGYIVLAHCYYDRGNYEQAYNVIRPLVAEHLDNTLLQRIFADTCDKLLLFEEALDTYKYLMFLNPKDEEISKKVTTIEAELLREKQSLLILPDSKPKQITGRVEDVAENWQRVDLYKSISSSGESEETEDKFEFFGEKEASVFANEDGKLSSEEIDSPVIQELMGEASHPDLADESPVMTLTLVDLYCAQNLYVEAEEVLNKILELSPNLETANKVKTKLAEVQSKKQGQSTKSEGYEDLMSFYDKKVNKKQFKVQAVQDKFQLFLEKLQTRSKEYSRNTI